MISGLQKMTLLDFPGKVACTVFLDGCNFRCPFCHNASLVLSDRADGTLISEEEFFTFLKKRKGLLDGVRLGPQYHFGWEMLRLPMEDLSGLRWSAEADGPRFLRGNLQIGETPKDTFLKLDGFTKGFVLVNGFNIGRYYNPPGPQKTLYIPAPLLRQGENEIIVFESDSFHSPIVEAVDAPDLG